MPLSAILAYAIALAIAAAIPGPGVASLVGRSLGTGFVRTLPMLVGLAVGDVVFLTAAILGLAVLAKAFGTFFMLIKLAGALYLAWLAWRFWTAGISVRRVEATGGKKEAMTAFLSGLFVTLGNPKTIVFYMAILPVVVDLKSVTLSGYLSLVLITFGVLFLVMTPYVALASKARQVLERPAARRRLNRVAAVVMASTAGWIIARA